MINDLDSLLSPISIQEFRAQYLDEKALYIKGDSDKTSGLFGWEDINHQINFGTHNYPIIKLIHDKQPLGSDALREFDKWMRDGATLAINSLQSSDPVVDGLATAIGRDLSTTVNINSYTSWPHKHGFDTHYDHHDVFILQLEGIKEWFVYEPTLKWPIEQAKQEQKSEEKSKDPYLVVKLNPGDVLYIPRGHWHHAIAIEPSIHLTVGPQPRSSIDFLTWLTEQLAGNEFFRKQIPFFGAREFGGEQDNYALQDYINEFQKRLTSVVNGDEFASMLAAFCFAKQPMKRLRNYPDQAIRDSVITSSTELKVPFGQKFVIMAGGESDSISVGYRGGVIRVTGLPEETINAILQPDTTISGDKIIAAYSSLEWSSIEPTLVKMVECGVLEPSLVD